MFKRLKDKITEEVKISPSKFSASVQQWQQMAQAVVSPTSNSVIEPPSMDSFSIDGDYDETPQNSPAHGSSRTSDRSTPTRSSIGDPSTFTLVDLQESTPTSVSGHASSRRSSFASTTSESPAILFPVFESGTANHFQSDLESCSERDESIFSSNVDNVSKEQLLSAFRKTQQRYHKYKGRYTDLIRHYRELERENTKARTILAECQDKALRRAAELKEQCQLEQKAKAHLEEVLRSDLEEKDHLIHTLETKIQLLKSGVDPSEVLSAVAQATAVANASTESPDLLSRDEPKNSLPNTALTESDVESMLKEKVTKLEGLLHKCKEAINVKLERISQLEKDKESLTDREAELHNKIKGLQLREEETSLSVAENKLMVHQELESKEELIRQLKKQLATANSTSTDLQKEIEQLQEGFKRDLAAGKQEASRLIQAEMQQIVGANRKLEELLATRDQQLSEHEASLSAANLRLQELKDQVVELREGKQLEASSELSTLQAKVSELELALERSDLCARLEPVLKPLREIKESAQQLREELTESLKDTKSYIEGSVQDIHSRSSQLLAESREELQRLREEHGKNQSEVRNLLEQIREMESSLKEKEEAVSSLESELSAERQANCDLKNTLDELKRRTESDMVKYDEAKRSLEKQLEKSVQAVQQYKTELEQVREGLLSAESSERKCIEELQEEIKRKDEEIKRFGEDLNMLEGELQKERCVVEELTVKANRVPSLETQIDSLKADNIQLLEDKTIFTANKNKEIGDLEVMNVSLSKEIDALKLEKNKLSEEIGRIEEVMVENETIQLSEMQKSETHLNEKNLENEELRNSLNKLQASYDLFKEEYTAVLRNSEESEKKYNELKSEFDAANSEVREKRRLLFELEEQLSSLSTCASELTLLKEEKQQLSETVALLESRLRQSSEELQDKEGLMEEKQVELGNLLNLKTQELQELREELDLCKTELSNRTNLLELKTREYESLANQSSAYADDLKAKSQDLFEKTTELEKLASRNASIERDFEADRERLKSIIEELTTLKKEDESLKQENQNLIEKLKAAEDAKKSLETQLTTVSEEYANQAHLLKVKTDEYAEKEAQLDNLADEMKRVDELSQELGRISDESEANVQVLSAEASSLAQKVEELTAKTQQMREREVELVAKAQLADECQAEFIQLKEAKVALQAKLARAEQAESQLAHLKEGHVELGNRLQKAEEFGKQCEHLRELASKVPELEKKCAQLKEAQERVDILEDKCARLAEECAKLEGAESKAAQLEAECQELKELSARCAALKVERDYLAKENSSLSELKEECATLKTENEKMAELSRECAELREVKSSAGVWKMRSEELEAQVKKWSDLEGELRKLREENSELRELRMRYENLSGVEQKLQHMEEECDRLRKECLNVSDLEAECKTRNARICELEEECARLKSENQLLSVEKTLEKDLSKDELDNQWKDERQEDKRCLQELEIECEDLRGQLKAAKAETDDLRSDLEFIRCVPVDKPKSPAKEQRISSLVSALEDDDSLAMPVVEEPMVAKKVKDLYTTKKGDDDDERQSTNKQNWKEAYESLLVEHNSSVQSHQQIIEDLKEQLKLREEKPRRKPWEHKEQDNTHYGAAESKAVGAEGNSVEVAERLQHQVAGLQTQLKDSKRQHRQEVSELRRMLLNNSHGSSHGACTLEDATELEYLRNILFEYMMGKEPMVLARVIAAVVKFDSDQTKKVLQKEEQRLTLLGHLGIS